MLPAFDDLSRGLSGMGFRLWLECFSLELMALPESERPAEMLLAAEAAREAMCTIGPYNPFAPGPGWRSPICEARRSELRRSPAVTYAQSLFFRRHSAVAESAASRKLTYATNSRKLPLLAEEAQAQQFELVCSAPTSHVALEDACEELIARLLLRSGWDSRRAAGGLCFSLALGEHHHFCLYWAGLDKGLRFADRGHIKRRCFLLAQDPGMKSINFDRLLAQQDAFEISLSKCVPGFEHYDHWVIPSRPTQEAVADVITFHGWEALDQASAISAVRRSWSIVGLSTVAALSLLNLLRPGIAEALASTN
jgi:hypothetical protein